jgi:dTDP-4-dehydrorhamnose 3,5-epimerase
MFKFTNVNTSGLVLVETDEHQDDRGYFSEIYRTHDFRQAGIGPFLQQNVSVSRAGVVRGLHFQTSPCEVGKLITCLHGEIWDVAVDLRIGSPHFKGWFAFWLSGAKSLWIPPGFAHGFYAPNDNTVVMYRQTGYYSKEHDRAIRWNDPSIGIDWPVKHPILSKKDADAPFLLDIIK